MNSSCSLNVSDERISLIELNVEFGGDGEASSFTLTWTQKGLQVRCFIAFLHRNNSNGSA